MDVLKKLTTAAVVLFVFAPSAFAENFAWHYLLTQSERNQAIISRARQDLGKNVNLNCKEWVRKVVRDASGGDVVIPQTLPDLNGWYWAYAQWVVELCMDIRNVERGTVLQTNWVRMGSPHTLIVQSVTSTGIWIIDSNRCGPTTVCEKFYSFADFNNIAPAYTVHYIY